MSVLDGITGLVQNIAGEQGEMEALQSSNTELLEQCQLRASRINDLEKGIEQLSDVELRAKTKEFRERLAGGASLDDVLEEAFAVVREAAWRILELRHYDVQVTAVPILGPVAFHNSSLRPWLFACVAPQLVAGMVLNDRRLAEMATGEGKTLVATLPTYLNALQGDGAFVVTANE